ncbi:hypothetical protein H6F75_00275 [Nodosilinea sp. FACHB-131]|uniref:hypothetical protein n=1 Tax=Cyanophyceae TaxID=3028117 RepID=UPI001688E6C1|nr:hypothetical protein [Nodosilinea sp. FACHB-131]MBD1871905.1 hypothetical protein [Nodosilinea sp. FACHB-131]
MAETEMVATKYAGADWMLGRESSPKASKLGIKVMNILGQVYQGIYHTDDYVLSPKIRWDSPFAVAVTVYGAMATFDAPQLTLLAMCCQKAEVSVVIDGSFKGYTKLVFAHNPGGSEVPSFLNLDESSSLELRLAQCTHIKKKLCDIERGAVYSTEPLGWHSFLALVEIAHRLSTRFQVVGRSPRSLEVMVTQRKPTGFSYERHPSWVRHKQILAQYVNVDYSEVAA